MKCKDCKYWQDHEYEDFEALGQCRHNKIEYEQDDSKYTSDMVVVGSRYYIQTGPDFGCIHFKEKEEK